MPRLSYKGQIVDVADNDRALLDYYLADGGIDVSAGLVGDFVAGSTVAQVLDRVGEVPALAGPVLEAEQARGEQARKSLVDALAPVVESADAVSAPQPGPTADPAA